MIDDVEIENKIALCLRHALWEMILEHAILKGPVSIVSNKTRIMHPTFEVLFRNWFELGLKINVPSLTKSEIRLGSRFKLKDILKELFTILKTTFPSIESYVFAQTQNWPLLNKIPDIKDKKVDVPCVVVAKFNNKV